MKISKLTTNGRITIPAPLRKKYGLTSGRHVKFKIVEDGIILIPLVTKEEIHPVRLKSQKKPLIINLSNGVRTNIGFLGMKGKLLKSLLKEKGA
jgi:AbrB family looped-hinge helix DNA binding protein